MISLIFIAFVVASAFAPLAVRPRPVRAKSPNRY
jgi:hypothetical protein